MKTGTAKERLAAYYTRCARQGGTPAQNIATHLQMTTASYYSARASLMKDGRLKMKAGSPRPLSFDGVLFGPVVPNEDIEALKTALRKRGHVVFDARTERDPTKVAHGRAKELCIDGHIVPLAELGRWL